MYAVVTGASSGLGMEMAKVLGELGFNLILTARRQEKIERLAYAIHKKFGVETVAMAYDLSREADCYAFHEACRPYDVTVLINNAGFGKVGFFDGEISLEEELAMIRTNVVGMHILLKLFARSMDCGFILNVASMAAYQSSPVMATYGATKAYVRHLSSSVGYELKRQRKPIHVATLCPGPVETEFDRVAGVRQSLSGMSAKVCARKAIYGMLKKKGTIIPGMSQKLLRIVSKLTPEKIILPVEYWIQNSKRKEP